MALDDLFQLTVVYTVSDEICQTGFAFKQISGDVFDDPCKVIGDEWVDDRLTEFTQMLSDTVQIQCIQVRRVEPSGAIPYVRHLTAVFGTIVSPALPANSPMVVKLKTDSDNSSDNGRYYLSGIGEVSQTDGLFIDIFITGPVAAFNAAQLDDLTDPVTGALWSWVILNRIDAGVPVVPVSSSLVNTMIASNRPASQKRRRTKQTRLPA